MYIMTSSKNITLPDDLVDYIRRENLNLSRFVQEKIRERMNGGVRSLDAFQGILLTSNYDEWKNQSSVVTDISKCRNCNDNDNCPGLFKEELIYKKDVLLRLEIENDCENDLRLQLNNKEKLDFGSGRDEETRKKIKQFHHFTYSWAADFADPWYFPKRVTVFYGSSKINTFQVISCDGGRITIAVPNWFKRGENSREREKFMMEARDVGTIPLFIRPIDLNISKIISQLNPMQFNARFPRRIQIG